MDVVSHCTSNVRFWSSGDKLWISSSLFGRCMRWFSSEFLRALAGRTGEIGVSSMTSGSCAFVSLAMAAVWDGEISCKVARGVLQA